MKHEFKKSEFDGCNSFKKWMLQCFIGKNPRARSLLKIEHNFKNLRKKNVETHPRFQF